VPPVSIEDLTKLQRGMQDSVTQMRGKSPGEPVSEATTRKLVDELKGSGSLKAFGSSPDVFEVTPSGLASGIEIARKRHYSI